MMELAAFRTGSHVASVAVVADNFDADTSFSNQAHIAMKEAAPSNFDRTQRRRRWKEQILPILETVTTASPGEQRERLFSAACRFREMIDKGDITREGARSTLQMEALLFVSQRGISLNEINRIIAAGLFRDGR